MTHNERVLQLLSDGKPHSHRELYGLYVIAHSRVSDLRKRGHDIEMWRNGDDYMYRLLSQGQSTPSGSPLTEQAVPGDAQSPPPPPAQPTEQLSLVAA